MVCSWLEFISKHQTPRRPVGLPFLCCDLSTSSGIILFRVLTSKAFVIDEDFVKLTWKSRVEIRTEMFKDAFLPISFLPTHTHVAVNDLCWHHARYKPKLCVNLIKWALVFGCIVPKLQYIIKLAGWQQLIFYFYFIFCTWYDSFA